MKNRIFAATLLLVGLGLGATIFRGQVPVGEAIVTPNTTNTTTTQHIRNEIAAKLQNEQNTMQIVERYESGLVFINTEEDVTRSFWFGESQIEVEKGVGSGFFVNKAGDLLTNYHVVAGQNKTADRIRIRLMGQEKTFEARIVGLAPQYDLALLRAVNLPNQLIQPIPLGNSSTLKVGQKTIAMGAPFGLDFSVSEGIVSNTSRQIPVGFSGNGEGIVQRVIQTDAAINPGNSGGPLLDSGGRVIGINTQIRTGGVGQNAGVGFAIPVDAARNLLPRLQMAKGGVVAAPRLGITAGLVVQNGRSRQGLAVGLSVLTDEAKHTLRLPARGLVIGQVLRNTPAARAGLRGGTHVEEFRGGAIQLGGDVIIEAAGQKIDSLEELQAILIDKKEGDVITLQVYRSGKIRQVKVVLDRSAFR